MTAVFVKQEIEQFIGRSFGGYRVTRFIASGRNGVIFAAIQEESPENAVAIKLLDPRLIDETFDERFEQIALGAAGLKHPNIVRVHDFGSDGPLHFIVTDLIQGESLRDQLLAAHAEGSSLTADTIISIAQQVGGALFFAHRSGYVHGDIKPENIMVTRDGWVHVSDFGLVRAIGEYQVTSDGLSAGTPEYLSPEQARGMTAITPLADLYSLGIVTYEMTVGRVPFQARSAASVIRMQAHSAPPLPSSLLPGFPPELEAVLMRGLEKDPSRRFESVDAFLGSLLAAMVPERHTTAPAVVEPVIVPEPPPAEATPAPVVPEAPEAPEPEIPVPLVASRPYVSTATTTPEPRFAAIRRHLGAVTGGVFALVLAALLVIIPAMWGSASPSALPETTTVTTGKPVNSAPSAVPAATPPPEPSPAAPPVHAITTQAAPPPPPPPASNPPASTAPASAPPVVAAPPATSTAAIQGTGGE